MGKNPGNAHLKREDKLVEVRGPAGISVARAAGGHVRVLAAELKCWV